MYITFTIGQVLSSTIHIGHLSKYRNNDLNFYLAICKNFVDFFDIYRLTNSLRIVSPLLENIGFRRKIFFAACQNNICFTQFVEFSKKRFFPFVCQKWWGGTFTNFKQIKFSSVKYNLIKKKGFDIFHTLGGRHAYSFRRAFKNKNYLVGFSKLYRVPDVVYTATVKLDQYILNECNSLEIPVLGLVDSNASTAGVTYIIPGNDESFESVFFVLKFFLNNYYTGFHLRVNLFFVRYFFCKKHNVSFAYKPKSPKKHVRLNSCIYPGNNYKYRQKQLSKKKKKFHQHRDSHYPRPRRITDFNFFIYKVR